MHRAIGIGAALIFLAAACTASAESEHQHLLILDESSNVVVYEREGGTSRNITSYEQGSSTAFQPIWAGNRHIVFSEASATASALVTTTNDGTEVLRVDLPSAPFYYAVEPGSMSTESAGRVLSLRSEAGAPGLIAETVATDGSVTIVGDESPFYFSWAPQGGEVVAHIGSARLETLLGSEEEVDASPGIFQAPWWTDRGIVYLRTGGPSQTVAVKDGDTVRDLAVVSGPAQMVLGGDRLAIQPLLVQEPGGVEVVRQTLPSVPNGRLSVIDLDSGEITQVTTTLTALFQWDPTGTRLLYGVPGAAPGTLIWMVWEDGETTRYAEFDIHPVWLSTFVPFFDQYAQSMTLWAPTGDAFAFPGAVGGSAGVWIQELAVAEPVRISSGSWVTWEPAEG